MNGSTLAAALASEVEDAAVASPMWPSPAAGPLSPGLLLQTKGETEHGISDNEPDETSADINRAHLTNLESPHSNEEAYASSEEAPPMNDSALLTKERTQGKNERKPTANGKSRQVTGKVREFNEKSRTMPADHENSRDDREGRGCDINYSLNITC